MGLYTNNGAAVGSGIPGGSHVGNQLTRHTGAIPAGQAQKVGQRSQMQPWYAQNRTAQRPQTTVSSVSSMPAFNGAAMGQIATYIDEARRQANALKAQQTALQGGYNSGTGQYWTGNRALDRAMASNKFQSHGNLSGRGIYSSGMANQNDQAIKESFQPQYNDIAAQYGPEAFGPHGSINQQRYDLIQPLVRNILNVLLTQGQANMPQIPNLTGGA